MESRWKQLDEIEADVREASIKFLASTKYVAFQLGTPKDQEEVIGYSKEVAGLTFRIKDDVDEWKKSRSMTPMLQTLQKFSTLIGKILNKINFSSEQERQHRANAKDLLAKLAKLTVFLKESGSKPDAATPPTRDKRTNTTPVKMTHTSSAPVLPNPMLREASINESPSSTTISVTVDFPSSSQKAETRSGGPNTPHSVSPMQRSSTFSAPMTKQNEKEKLQEKERRPSSLDADIDDIIASLEKETMLALSSGTTIPHQRSPTPRVSAPSSPLSSSPKASPIPQRAANNEEVKRLNEKIEEIQNMKKKAVDEEKFELAHSYKEQLTALENRRKKLMEEIASSSAAPVSSIDNSLVEQWTQLTNKIAAKCDTGETFRLDQTSREALKTRLRTILFKLEQQ